MNTASFGMVNPFTEAAGQTGRFPVSYLEENVRAKSVRSKHAKAS
jgi:hypothetical protein